MTTPDLAIGCDVASELGLININDANAGYQLHAESRTQAAQTYRKQEVASAWVAGTYVVHAVRENVVENLSVWVRGIDHGDMQDKLLALFDVIESPVFTVTWRFPAASETWNCQYAEYTVKMEQAFQHASMALVQMQIPRLPRINYVPGGQR